ncbi:2-C-methyl-D-erythritol 4-phosphate cytidylyltransferase [Shewanella pealeana]|uniref:2-C-methyl-D-erythritol 4-phosphate cytidylyltransferase n=1 Tax=Shewanella pealeana (strain ATCC 700345 / ANG-SQ1) TaxID=398579 RepID=ISPD_SHEPA|nr:2-C-methyl-D-erythritol 4-phosphate cytidylyltransferase [Shewanella pealeana]A8H1S7.1 RecName: Full=2-C-methyl-D-erythritol 4-phosphate cytidylyltransferase; AltName: Full=4-diphosphocytidyl-2C-methyl-D-erythritol synthase; AltName: Full=MEP cytidylyltransferase; Short=MCT [Shewanella pealeana ATCC 700345]ABV86514.1 2-C-methyl-D-erythritol 4-phosphate cytidylyltransferase [Shewanella pealeana ATCC 700345]
MSQTPKHIISIVPAAGIGSRMGAEIPKQYLQLNEQSILGHTLDCLLSHPSIEKVIVALNPEDEFFARLPQAQHAKLQAVIGGKERADSVLSALTVAPTDAWALVHDAARPCLNHQDIDKLIESASSFPQGAILGAPVRDTMKRSNAQGLITETVCREKLWHALTPQFFPVQNLKQNLSNALAAGALITDEASAMEWAGVAPGIVAGRADNIKVTHPDDLQLASLFLKSAAQ